MTWVVTCLPCHHPLPPSKYATSRLGSRSGSVQVLGIVQVYDCLYYFLAKSCNFVNKQTRFCLGEALQIVEDFSCLTHQFFPSGAVATAMNKKAMPPHLHTPENVSHRLNAIQMTKFLIQF